MAYNSLVNLLQDRLYSDTERAEIIYQNDVQSLLSSIVGNIVWSLHTFVFQSNHEGIKFVGTQNGVLDPFIGEKFIVIS